MDVWAIGVILFELCTGRTLFAQDISDNEIVDKMSSIESKPSDLSFQDSRPKSWS
jgi:hypothetical protein